VFLLFILEIEADLDENGRYKAHETEPTTITVKELGISGWLKGREKTK